MSNQTDVGRSPVPGLASRHKVAFGFKPFMAALIDMFDVPQDQRKAFEARVKNLQRIGVVPREQPGKGRYANYTADQLWKAVFIIEMQALGVPPATADEHYVANADQFAQARQDRSTVVLKPLSHLGRLSSISIDTGSIGEVIDRHCPASSAEQVSA